MWFHIFIFRAADWPAREVGIPQLHEGAQLPGPFTPIGTLPQSFLQDPSAVDMAQYAHSVHVGAWRAQVSDSSKLAIAPSLVPPVNFDQLETMISNLAGRGRVKPVEDGGRMVRLSWRRGGLLCKGSVCPGRPGGCKRSTTTWGKTEARPWTP